MTYCRPEKEIDINSALKCSICPFRKRTSEIQFPLLQRVEVGEGVVDELRGEPHLSSAIPFKMLEQLDMVYRSTCILSRKIYRFMRLCVRSLVRVLSRGCHKAEKLGQCKEK